MTAFYPLRNRISHRHWLSLFFVLFVSNVYAQTTVTVGTASSASELSGPTNSTTSGARTERHTAIYSVAELTAAGLAANTTLMSIGWNKTGTGNYMPSDLTINIYLKHSASATFGANPTYANEIGSATLVYNTTTGSIPEAAGWQTFIFQTPFVWNGTENLQVIVEFIRPGSWTDTDFNWTTLSSVTNSAANVSGNPPSATMTRTGTRPQIQLTAATNGNDAALIAMPNPVSAPAGPQNIQVSLRNTGTAPLTSATIEWTVNGNTPTVYQWTGSLGTGAGTLVTLGSFSFTGGPQTVQAVITSANGGADASAGNNTVSKSILICSPLSGAYTLNNGAATGGTNFASLTDLAYYLSNCGVSGSVTVTAAPGSGPYVEQVVFQNIAGLSASNQLTIEGNGVTLTTAAPIDQSGSNPNRHILRLIDLQYVTINNFVINMVPGSTGFIGIHVLGNAQHITLSNNTVNMGTATSTLLGAFVFNNAPASILTPGGTFSNINVTGNTVTGGGYGVSVVGLAPPLATNVAISNNNFNDFNSNGVYLRETDGAVVSGNAFNKSAGTVSTTNAIQLAQSANVNGRIFNNRIRMTQTDGSMRGIYLFAGTGHRVYNNAIYDIRSTSGDVTGIQLRTASSAPEVYFNTMAFDNGTASTANLYGIRMESNGTGANLRNNLISITQATTGMKAAYMLSSNTGVTTTVSSNHNLFWVPGGQVAAYNNVTTPTALAANLANWRTISSQDADSRELDPVFFSAALPRPTNLAADNAGTPIAFVTTDIVGVSRAGVPDVGAYEFPVAAGPLPVQLLTFSGLREAGANRLRWITSGEENNRGFYLERSLDGRSYTALGFVASAAANGTSRSQLTYGFTDAQPPGDRQYYRLRQVDLDGREKLSPIVLLRGGASGAAQLTGVYPNPVRSQLNVSFQVPAAALYSVRVLDAGGRTVLQQQARVDRGSNTVVLELSALPSGTYHLELRHREGGDQLTASFVKQ